MKYYIDISKRICHNTTKQINESTPGAIGMLSLRSY